MAPPARVYDDAFYDDARFRILSKSEVGGVIFCCNKDQIAECLEKKLLCAGIPTDLDLQSLSISAQTTVDDYYESCKARFQQAVSYYASLKEAKAKDKVEDDEMDNVEDDEMDNVEDDEMDMEGERMQLYKWEYEDWEYELMKNEVIDEDYDEDAWRMGGYIDY
ncbi:hypothetical protein LINGRAHAP2_LOCUS36091 [Linum grandiflorum]